MCGITGYFSRSGRDRSGADELKRMTAVIAHRGPDAHGLWFGRDRSEVAPGCEHDVALGHRRLSIIDLSEAGTQPMTAADGKVSLTYNGELYNYKELRAELEEGGCEFVTETDTEVLLRAYLVWGTSCFARFNGMWSLAIYDGREDVLVLSRDRYGKKPLYYNRAEDRFVFGSECKALFECEGISKQPNLRKVANYLARHYRVVDADVDSFFDGIQQVPPAHFSVVGRDLEIRSERYWSLEEEVDAGRDEIGGLGGEEVEERFVSLVNDAVRLRLRSDVPVGVLLSGGLDSTTIAAMVAREQGKVSTFSSVTGEGYFDESEYIDSIVEHIGADAEYIRPKDADLLETLEKILLQHDEPVCTVSWYSFYLLIEAMEKSGFPVVLTGHGGDELLGGYWDHYHYRFADLREAGGEGADEAEVQAWLKNHQRGMEEYHDRRPTMDAWKADPSVFIRNLTDYTALLDLDPSHVATPAQLLNPVPAHWPNLDRRMHGEMLYETVPASLRAEDRNCMAFSIENRVPFLDYRLAEFCFALPGEYKIRGGLGKALLRDVTDGLLPDKVRLRKDKTGHNYPFDLWLQGEGKPVIDDIVGSSSDGVASLVNSARLGEIWKEQLAGENHGMFFWQLLNVDRWMKQHF